MVSPADVALIEGWRRGGVSADVVVGALQETARRFVETHPPSEPMPSTLAYFQPAIDQLVAHRREMLLDPESASAPLGNEPQSESLESTSPTDSVADPLQRVKDVVVAAGRLQTEESIKEILRSCWRDLNDVEGAEDPWTLTAELNERVVNALVEATPPAERERLFAEAEKDISSNPSISERAKRDRTQTAFWRLVRDHYDVPDLREALR